MKASGTFHIKGFEYKNGIIFAVHEKPDLASSHVGTKTLF